MPSSPSTIPAASEPTPPNDQENSEVQERFQSGIRLRGAGADVEASVRADLEVQDSALHVEIDVASDSQFFCGLDGDVAEGGVFVATYRPFAIGAEVALELALADGGAPVRARGEVRWLREHSRHEPRGVGITLRKLSPRDRKRVRAFCKARPPLYYEVG